MKLSLGQRIAGGGALLLFICLWLPWYGTKHVYTETGLLLPARYVTINAWESFRLIDIVLLLAILVVIFSIFRTVGRPRSRQLRATASIAAAAAGLLAAILVFYRQLDPLDPVERKFGLLLGLLAVVAMLAGGVRWMDEEEVTIGGVSVADVRRRLSDATRRIRESRQR